MSLRNGSPRAAYRVYDEDAYLAGGDCSDAEETALGEECAERVVHPAEGGRTQDGAIGSSSRLRARRSHGPLGLALLLGVTLSALGLIALGGSHQLVAPTSSSANRGVVPVPENELPSRYVPSPPKRAMHRQIAARHARPRVRSHARVRPSRPQWREGGQPGVVVSASVPRAAERDLGDEFGFER